MSILIQENWEKNWTITKVNLEHFGHVVTENEYFFHTQNRKLNNERKDYLRELLKTKASTKNVAACLSRKTGKEFNSKDVSNLIQKLKTEDFTKPSAESVLGKIQDDGGFVRYSRDTTGFVDVLYVQTAEMKQMMKREKPRVFQADTTFGKDIYLSMGLLYHNLYL